MTGMFSSLDYQEKIWKWQKHHEDIKEAKSGFKQTNSKFLSVFDKWREHGRVLTTVFLGWRIHGGQSIKGSMTNFQDFEHHGSFQACPIFALLFQAFCYLA